MPMGGGQSVRPQTMAPRVEWHGCVVRAVAEGAQKLAGSVGGEASGKGMVSLENGGHLYYRERRKIALERFEDSVFFFFQ